MSQCEYKVGGRTLTEKELEERVELISSNSGLRLANLSQDMITTEEALKIVKAWIPNATVEGQGT